MCGHVVNEGSDICRDLFSKFVTNSHFFKAVNNGTGLVKDANFDGKQIPTFSVKRRLMLVCSLKVARNGFSEHKIVSFLLLLLLLSNMLQVSWGFTGAIY